MYSRNDFVVRFRSLDNDTLLDRLAHEELTDEAREALLQVLGERGIEHASMQAGMVQARKDRFRRSGVTNQCDYCGGAFKKKGVLARPETGQLFCSPHCRESAYLLEVAVDIPNEQIVQATHALWTGACPKCRKSRSKIDVHSRHWVWSAVFITRHGYTTRVCCRHCSVNANLLSLASNLLLGWWGFPFGLVITPVKVAQNLNEIFRSDRQPSPALENMAKVQLAKQRLRRAAQPPVLEMKRPP